MPSRAAWLLLLLAIVCQSTLAEDPAKDEQDAETKNVHQAEADAYERVAQVAKKLASVQRKAAAEQLKANGLMDDELHHLNTIGSLTLAQRKNAKEIENKRYRGVQEERVEVDKAEKVQQGEIKELKAELSKVTKAHAIAAKASERADKAAKVKYMNERSHKVNTKEEAIKTKKERDAKAEAKRKGNKLLRENEARERNFKVGREKEMEAAHTKLRDETNVQHAKAKAEAKMAQSKVTQLAKTIKTMRKRDDYMQYVNKYKAAVVVEDQKLDDLKVIEARKKKQETALAEEKKKFNEKKKAQVRAAAVAKENHEKAVSGRESRNCHKFCKLYRVATDSTSTSTRAKTLKKKMCFAEPKAEATETAQQEADKQQEQGAKKEKQAAEQKAKDEEVEQNEDDPNKQPKQPSFKELGEGEEPSCVGMECTCVVYTSYDGADDMDGIDNSGVIGKRR